MSNAPNDPHAPNDHDEAEGRHERPLTASVEKLRRELDHWLDVAWSQGEKALDAFGLKGSIGWTPAIDVMERGDDVFIFVDVPGVDPHTIDLTLAGNMLSIKGERFCPTHEDGQLHVRTRPRGKFTRSIPLPVPVEAEKVSADAKDGVLTIHLVKSERAKSRQIPVGGRTVT